MLKFIQDLFTERDGISWCLGRITGFAAAVEMMVEFFRLNHSDYQGFAIGISAIITAIAAKNYSEK